MVVDRVMVVVVVSCHLLRNVCGYGSARGPSLTLGSCCGGRAGASVGGVFEGSLRGASSNPRLLLKHQLSAQRSPV